MFSIKNLLNPEGQDAEGVSDQYWVVRAQRVPPVRSAQASHPTQEAQLPK